MEQDTREQRFDAWLALTGQRTGGGEPLRLPLLSGSMAPALPPDSILVIEPSPPAGFRVGDVVVFAENDRLVAHRVLLRLPWPGGGVVFEMGDANPQGRWRRSRAVRGVVVGAEDAAGGAIAPKDGPGAVAGLWRHLRHGLRGPAGTGSEADHER